jgi:uncharacterized protein (DUF302 family)
VISMDYAISKSVTMSFNDTVNRVSSELQKEGFGIITEIDLKSKFREKLGKDFRNYTILGACNPKLAYEAIEKESHIGVMLPCNVLVQEHEDGQVEVSAINPMQSIGVIGKPELEAIATQVSEKLKAALDRI